MQWAVVRCAPVRVDVFLQGLAMNGDCSFEVFATRTGAWLPDSGVAARVSGSKTVAILAGQSCKTLNVHRVVAERYQSFWHYLGDRIGLEGQAIPPLATLVATRA